MKRTSSRTQSQAAIAVTAVLLLSWIAPITGVASEQILFQEDFEGYSVGVLPFGVGEWVLVDDWGQAPTNASGVVNTGGDHGNALRLVATYDNERSGLGARFVIPALEEGEILEVSLDVRLNDSYSYFFVEVIDRWFGPAGYHGEFTDASHALTWLLVNMSHRSGTVGDPLFPYTGAAAGVMSGEDPQNPNGPRNIALANQELEQGVWYRVALTYGGLAAQLSIDGQVVAQLPIEIFALSEDQDWMLMLGDGDSHSYARCDTSFDNLLVRVITESKTPAWWAEPRRAQLRVTSIQERGDTVSLVVKNVGGEACSGPVEVLAGLACDRTWVPEWETWFFSAQLPAVSLEPGEDTELQLAIGEVPDTAREVLARRMSTLWSAYRDKDPDVDYVGLTIGIGEAHPAHAFLPAD